MWFLPIIALIYNFLTKKVKLITMHKFYCLICIVLSLLLFSCKTLEQNNEAIILQDNKYDSEFPSKSVSKQLNYISSTVKKLDVLAFYSNYFFPKDSNIIINNINDSLLASFSKTNTITHESVLGTTSIIYADNSIIGLLTCAHVVDFSDTLYSYYDPENIILKSISIKIKQQNHVGSLEAGEPIEIVAINKKQDIALLIKKAIPFNQRTPVLNYPVGSIKDLQWGSLVYIMGYPLGNLMVTRAIASITSKIKTGIFVTDALYNHGISGSPVFAIRDGIPNFELIGMASSAAAQQSNILTTDDEFKTNNELQTPYYGDIFVDKKKLISYGVTYSISIDEIITFINFNEKHILDAGFDINMFFK